jgi:hypothetical protein
MMAGLRVMHRRGHKNILSRKKNVGKDSGKFLHVRGKIILTWILSKLCGKVSSVP